MITFQSLFKAQDLETTTQQLADSIPNGKAWNTKNIPDSITRKLIKSVAASFHLIKEQIETLAQEFNINVTNDLLPDWEDSVNIPDECILVASTLSQRRTNVIARLRKLPIVTTQDFEDLALEVLASSVTVSPGTEKFILYVDIVSVSEGLGFVYAFPLVFSSSIVAKIQCLFEYVIPANVILEINTSP